MSFLNKLSEKNLEDNRTVSNSLIKYKENVRILKQIVMLKEKWIRYNKEKHPKLNGPKIDLHSKIVKSPLLFRRNK